MVYPAWQNAGRNVCSLVCLRISYGTYLINSGIWRLPILLACRIAGELPTLHGWADSRCSSQGQGCRRGLRG